MLRTRVITALVLLAAVLGALTVPWPWLWGLLSLVLFGAAGWEWARLIGADPVRVVVAIALGGLAWMLWRGQGGPVGVLWLTPALIITLLAWLNFAIPSVLRAEAVGRRAWLAIISLLALWLSLYELRIAGPVPVVSAMTIVWCADIGAYFVGRAFGRRKLAPRVSPGKSWEGAGGGLATAVIVALVAAWAGKPPDVLTTVLAQRAGVAAMVAGLVVLVALSVLGDLYESQLKRTAGVKDSGHLLPGHGGVLDRPTEFDALADLDVDVDAAALVDVGGRGTGGGAWRRRGGGNAGTGDGDGGPGYLRGASAQ